MAAVIRLPDIILVQIIFSGPLGSLNSFLVFFLNWRQNRVLLKTVLWSMAVVAHLITGHEQTQ